MTPAQLQTLKADLAANTATVLINGIATQIKDVPRGAQNAGTTAEWYLLTAAPDYLVWRTSVDITEIMLNGFDWTRVDNLSVGKSRIWEWMTQLGTINPSKPNIRAGIDATWVGTQADLNVRAAVYTHCYRLCTRIERLFVAATSGGSGTRGTSANPDTMGFEGEINGDDIIQAWAA
jgi:hypothetical protein